MNLLKPNILKSVALLVSLLTAGGNVHATEYECDPLHEDEGVTFNQILSPLPILASERPFIPAEKIAWMNEKIARNDVHADRFIKQVGNNRTNSDSGFANALAYRLTGSDAYLEQARVHYKRMYVDNNAKHGSDVIGYEYGCHPNNFRSAGKYLPLYYMWLYDELTEEERAHAVRTMAYVGEYWLKYIPGNNTTREGNKGKPQRPTDSDETVMLAENLLFYGLALRGTELGDRLIAMSDKYFEEYVVPLYITGIFEGGVWGEGLQYSINTNVHWPLTYLLNKQLRPEKLAEYTAKGWDFDKYFNNSIEGYIYITVGDKVQSWTQGSNQNPYTWFLGEEFILPNLYRGLAVFSGATTSEHHKKLANGYMEDLKNKWGALRSMNTGAWHMLFEEPSVGTLSPQTAGMPTTFVAEGPNIVHTRTDWSADASSFYIAATSAKADHINQDTLAFDYFRKGQKMSGERYSYEGDTADAIGHNMLLIEGPENYATEGSITVENGGRCESCTAIDPMGDGEILHHAEAPNYNYVALDGTLPYNFKKDVAESFGLYIPHVSRQVVNIKPDAFIVFDNVITDKTKYYDFRWSTAPIDDQIVNGEWIRKIEYLQHFEGKPILDDDGFLVSLVEGELVINAGDDQVPVDPQQIKFKSLLPLNPITDIVDEEALWGLGTAEDPATRHSTSVPPEQRKWHIRVRPQERQDQVKFLSMFFGGDENAVVTPTQEVVMNKGNGIISDLSADVMGVALEMAGEWHVIIFPERPDVDVSNVSYDISFIPDGAVVHHYVNGVSEDNYFYNESNGAFSFSSASGTPITNNAGSLYQRTQDGLPYEEFETPSVPTDFVLNESNASELGFSWTPATDNVAVTSYAIYRGTSATDAVPYITVNGPSLTDTGLSPDTSYTYTVVALDLDGNESSRSEPFTAKTQFADYRAPILVRTHDGSGDTKETDGGSTGGSTGGTSGGSTAILRPLPYPEIRTVAFDDELQWFEGVYPAAGSADIDVIEGLLLIDFTAPFDFKYSRYGKLTITNLETGESVFTIDPEEGDEGDQGGYTSKRYALELPQGILEPETNYEVTITKRFAGFQNSPYKMEQPLESGVWTFSTSSASPITPEEPEGPSFTELEIAGTQAEALLDGGDFESGTNIIKLDHRTSGAVTDVNPISGTYSAELALQKYGRARVEHAYPWGAEVYAKALHGYSQVRLPLEAIPDGGEINLCVVAIFAGNTKDMACKSILGNPGEVVTAEPVLHIDPTKNVRRIYSWYQYLGYEGTINVTVDDLELVLYRLDTE